MPRVITYSLRLDARNSDGYYRAIARFADDWTIHAGQAMEAMVAGFRRFRQGAGLANRSDAEYTFELLALGVLLREHGPEIGHLPNWLARTMKWLAWAQDRWPQAEGPVKVLRGVAGWLARHRLGRGTEGSDVGRLVEWLRANGETSKADRFAQWQDYLEAIGQHAARRVILHCLVLADEFAVKSSLALGPYTEEVEHFLSDVAPRSRLRYDAELVSRSRLEYHLGLLGTQILNRAYRERFLAAGRKIVIVPPCMRAQPEEKCKALPTPLGARCQACTPSCRVHQITKLGEKRGFEVYIIPDELRVFGPGIGRGNMGLVGVSCALTNWGGGWEADAMGVPAQGMLLDYVGCKFHWDEKGIPTDVNLRMLEELVGARKVEER